MNAHLLPYPYNQSLKKPRFTLFSRYVAKLLRLVTYEQNPPLCLDRRSPPITLICISDTHNAICSVPEGDVLIHAGDLTQHGTFDELQAQLNWLKSLPHLHKVVIAGNHDLLLDDAFIEKFPARAPDVKDGKRKHDLDWGGIVYLEDSSVTFTFSDRGDRELKIFGSPKTPEFGTWAFQYPAIRDVWTKQIPDDADIVVVHGPPLLHCDVDQKGDGYLLKELRRITPRIVVCGHIHDGHGESIMLHDGVQHIAEEIRLGWGGLGALFKMLILVFISWLKFMLGISRCNTTTVVNAAIAPSENNKRSKDAIKVHA